MRRTELTTVALAMAAIVAFVACGSGADEADGTVPASTAEATTETEGPSELVDGPTEDVLDVAAVVEGEEILVAEVANLMLASPDNAPGTQNFAGTLFNLIVDRVLAAAADSMLGVTLDTAAVDAELAERIPRLTEGGLSLEAALEAQGLNVARFEAIARQAVLFEQINDALIADAPAIGEADLEAAYDQALQQLTTVCARHILLETEEEAQAALDRAVAGEDFAALAAELSIGPSGPDGGDLGCGSPANYVPEFAIATIEAEVNVPFGPVRTQFGEHVILVSERTVPTIDEARSDLEASLNESRSQELFFEWATSELAEAAVEVTPGIGIWITDPQPTVLAPDG